MEKVKVKIKHNPYTIETKIEIEGKEVARNSKLSSLFNKTRFQEHVSEMPQLLYEECNGKELDITFHGTKLDYQDLEFELKKQKEDIKNINGKFYFNLEHISAKESSEKIKELDDIYENLKGLSKKYNFQDLNIKSLEEQYEKAKGIKTEVNVVALMSAGKSTLINALLGKELLTTNSQACTAKVMKIIDNDNSKFIAIGKDISGKPKITISDVTAEAIKEMNNDQNIKSVEVKGNIPFVDTKESALVLLDSPGTNYSEDKTHKEATLKMIKESPKVLVLFIIDAQNASTNDQKELFKAISESMNGEEDKMLKERFLFVINKIDSTFKDVGTNPGLHLQDIINKIVKPLKEFGIENPNIFPVSAEIAFNIRNINNIFSLDRDTIQAKMKFMNMNEEFHLEKYSKLPSMNKEKIDKELKEAIKKDDIEKQALIHSGIRNLEEAISVFVTKYSKPAKVNSLQKAIKSSIKDAKSITETIEAIPNESKKLEEYSKKIEILKNKLSSKEANREFKEKIDTLNVTEELENGLANLKGNIELNIAKFKSMLPKEIEPNKVNEYLLEFKNMMLSYQSYFEKKTKELLKTNIEEVSKELLKEYIKKLNKISEEVNIKEINLSSYVNTEINLLKNSVNVEEILENEQTRTEYYSDYEWRERKWYNPFRIFCGKDYKVAVTKSKEVRFIEKDYFFEQLLTSVRIDLDNTVNEIKKIGEESAKNIKKEFSNRFDEVDNVLFKISTNLEEITINRDILFKKQEEAKKLKAEIEKIKEKLNEILEI